MKPFQTIRNEFPVLRKEVEDEMGLRAIPNDESVSCRLVGSLLLPLHDEIPDAEVDDVPGFLFAHTQDQPGLSAEFDAFGMQPLNGKDIVTVHDSGK